MINVTNEAVSKDTAYNNTDIFKRYILNLLLLLLVILFTIQSSIFFINLNERKKVANELECYMQGTLVPTSFQSSTVEILGNSAYTSKVRSNIKITTINECNGLNSLLSQESIMKYMSSTTYLRLKGINYRKETLAEAITTSELPDKVYAYIDEENESLNECIGLEIEYLVGKRGKRNIGNWVGRTLPDDI